LHPRVDLPDGRCTRVPEGGDGGADGDVHNVAVEQDLDQSLKGPKATLPAKASLGSLNLFLKLCNYPCYVCAFTFHELNETLDE
jgi:hypothetical protein